MLPVDLGLGELRNNYAGFFDPGFGWEEGGRGTPAVLEVMRNTPRHMFVDEALAQRAYEDSSLPIGYNQTLSQPWVVAPAPTERLQMAPSGAHSASPLQLWVQ